MNCTCNVTPCICGSNGTTITGATITNTLSYPATNVFIDEPISLIEDILAIKNGYGALGKCSKCKQDKPIKLTYNVIKVERKICNECLLKTVDKLFGIETNVELESALYAE